MEGDAIDSSNGPKLTRRGLLSGAVPASAAAAPRPRSAPRFQPIAASGGTPHHDSSDSAGKSDRTDAAGRFRGQGRQHQQHGGPRVQMAVPLSAAPSAADGLGSSTKVSIVAPHGMAVRGAAAGFHDDVRAQVIDVKPLPDDDSPMDALSDQISGPAAKPGAAGGPTPLPATTSLTTAQNNAMSNVTSAGARGAADKVDEALEDAAWPPSFLKAPGQSVPWLAPVSLPFSRLRQRAAADAAAAASSAMGDQDDEDEVRHLLCMSSAPSSSLSSAAAYDLHHKSTVAQVLVDMPSEAAAAFDGTSCRAQVRLGGELLHFTLPSKLPFSRRPDPGSSRRRGGHKSGAVGSSAAVTEEDSEDPSARVREDVRSIPAGRIGKLRVFQSGRAVITIGGVSFDVNLGVQRQMVQQVVAVISSAPPAASTAALSTPASAAPSTSAGGASAARLAMLGPVVHTLCVVPDVEAVMESMARERRSAVPASYAAMAELLRVTRPTKMVGSAGERLA